MKRPRGHRSPRINLPSASHTAQRVNPTKSRAHVPLPHPLPLSQGLDLCYFAVFWPVRHAWLVSSPRPRYQRHTVLAWREASSTLLLPICIVQTVRTRSTRPLGPIPRGWGGANSALGQNDHGPHGRALRDRDACGTSLESARRARSAHTTHDSVPLKLEQLLACQDC